MKAQSFEVIQDTEVARPVQLKTLRKEDSGVATESIEDKGKRVGVGECMEVSFPVLNI